jgi:hypothetical protein
MLLGERDRGDGNTAGWRSEAISFSYAVDHNMVKSMADQDEGVLFQAPLAFWSTWDVHYSIFHRSTVLLQDSRTVPM